MKILLLALLSVLAASGCNDDMPTQPPAPLDVSGAWQGTLIPDSNIRYVCAGAPVAVTAAFTQSGLEVAGTFAGGCLDGATFQGRVQDRRLLGRTQLTGGLNCPDAGATGGPASDAQLSLRITVIQNPISGTCAGPFGSARGTLTVELTR